VAPPPYFSSAENVTSVDRFAGGLGGKGPYAYPQDAPSSSPSDHAHGSRACELFVSIFIFLSRRSRTDTDGADHKLLERLEAELNLLRKNLYAVSPDVNSLAVVHR